MNKQQFIDHHNERTKQLDTLIRRFDEKLELDWRDSQELEIHKFSQDGKNLVDILGENGFEVCQFDFRYTHTLRINFVDKYFGSYRLEKYDEDEFQTFCEDNDVELDK